MNSVAGETSLGDSGRRLLGLAHLMRAAFRGEDLMPLAQAMMERAARDEHDAEALFDLSTILQLQGIRDVGLATLDLALQIKRVVELPSRRPTRIRLLALMAPGDLMVNAPLPFLLEDSDISLTMLYLVPGEPLPERLPEHDLIFVAIAETTQTHQLLEQLAVGIRTWDKPVLIRPERIMLTSRATTYDLLRDTPGIRVAPTLQASRQQLLTISTGEGSLQALSQGFAYPVIVRPVDSHAGHGLERIDDAIALAAYLREQVEDEFFVSRFIDYSGADGLFRKYRVVLIDGVPYAGHMGVSKHWMIHYLNAGMTESAAKRAEEEQFMRDFDADFAPRHAAALQTLHQRFGLEYLVIDCAQTGDGDLLVFEVDPGAVVHAMDPEELFPYKRPAMQRIFTAFRSLLLRAAQAV
jgi:hypothetical protein